MTLLVLGLLIPGRNVLAALPDPGELLTIAEIEQIVGGIKDGPRTIDPEEGAVACEYTLADGESWLHIQLFPSSRFNFEDAIRKFGGEAAIPLPELGKGAFANPSVAGVAASVYVSKGNIILEVSLPEGEGSVERLKAIARKALTRL